MKRIFPLFSFAIMATIARADEIPACALSGSNSVMINGRMALRLSDVKNCPPELYEINKSVFIEGEPTVYFKGGKVGDTVCGATGSNDVVIEGKQASRIGDAHCKTVD